MPRPTERARGGADHARPAHGRPGPWTRPGRRQPHPDPRPAAGRSLPAATRGQHGGRPRRQRPRGAYPSAGRAEDEPAPRSGHACTETHEARISVTATRSTEKTPLDPVRRSPSDKWDSNPGPSGRRGRIPARYLEAGRCAGPPAAARRATRHCGGGDLPRAACGTAGNAAAMAQRCFRGRRAAFEAWLPCSPVRGRTCVSGAHVPRPLRGMADRARRLA